MRAIPTVDPVVKGRVQAVIGAAVGIAVLLAVWAWVARAQPELVMPSPSETWSSITGFADDGTLWRETARTIWRALLAVAAAVAIGLVWGTVNGLSSWCAAVSRVALAVLMALPPIVLVVVSLIWLGPGAATTRLVIVLVALPLVVIAVAQAINDIDPDLLEMANAFEFSRWATIRQVTAPAIASPVLAAVTVAISQSLRVAVMAELLSAADGIGAEVARARANVETADVFAWALVLVVVVLAIELLVLRPLTRRLLRWREAA